VNNAGSVTHSGADQMVQAAMGFYWEPLLWAFALLVVAGALLILEFFVLSFGLLLLGALAAVAGAIYFAFQASPVAGWLFVVATPAIGFGLTRWGLARVQQSKLIPKSEVSAEAGYHHLADQLGVRPGSVGKMVTPAHPSGRARFSGGECDVQVVSGSLERAASVQVERIEGPVVYVTLVESS